jgi:hypothetical protein
MRGFEGSPSKGQDEKQREHRDAAESRVVEAPASGLGRNGAPASPSRIATWPATGVASVRSAGSVAPRGPSTLGNIMNDAVDELGLEKNPIMKVKGLDTSDHVTYTEEEPNALTPEAVQFFSRGHARSTSTALRDGGVGLRDGLTAVDDAAVAANGADPGRTVGPQRRAGTTLTHLAGQPTHRCGSRTRGDELPLFVGRPCCIQP